MAAFSIGVSGVEATRLAPFGVLIERVRGHATIGELPQAMLRAMVLYHGLVVLRGFAHPLVENALTGFGTSWGEVVTWQGGPVYDVHVRPSDDEAMSEQSLVLHWEGAFERWRCDYQIFSCVEVEPGLVGGETIFSNTRTLWSASRPAQQAFWRQLVCSYKQPEVASAPVNPSDFEIPLIEDHPILGSPVIHICIDPTGARACTYLELHRIGGGLLAAEEAAGILRDLAIQLHGDRFCYSHRWQVADVVIADNAGVLHGRKAFRGKRRLQRVLVVDPALRQTLDPRFRFAA